MSWETCNVSLNSSNGVFYVGDIVTGNVSLIFNNKQDIKDLRCTIIGLYKAQWSRPQPTIPFIKIYSEKLAFLKITLNIFDSYIGKTIRPGIQSENFNFFLPEHIPSSFKSSIGKIKYFILLEGKGRCKVKKHKIVPFIVLGKVNLNHLETFVTPCFFEIHMNFRLSGRISMWLKTYTGFSQDQTIPFEVLILNEDEIRISNIKILLIQKLEYNVPAGYACEEKNICVAKHNLHSKKTKNICNFSICIPEIIPSSVHILNPVINISYIFRLEISFPFHFTKSEDIPVTVATFPVIHKEVEQIKTT